MSAVYYLTSKRVSTPHYKRLIDVVIKSGNIEFTKWMIKLDIFDWRASLGDIIFTNRISPEIRDYVLTNHPDVVGSQHMPVFRGGRC